MIHRVKSNNDDIYPEKGKIQKNIDHISREIKTYN